MRKPSEGSSQGERETHHCGLIQLDFITSVCMWIVPERLVLKGVEYLIHMHTYALVLPTTSVAARKLLTAYSDLQASLSLVNSMLLQWFPGCLPRLTSLTCKLQMI